MKTPTERKQARKAPQPEALVKDRRLWWVIGALYLEVIYMAFREGLAHAQDTGTFYRNISLPWMLIFGAFAAYALLTAAGFSLAALGRWSLGPALERLRARLGAPGAWAVVLGGSALLQYFILFHRYGYHLQTSWTRWLLFIPWLALCAALLPLDLRAGDRPHTRLDAYLLRGLAVSLGFFALFAFLGRFARVSDYPFILSWSEGNRFYDYSLIFARDLYAATGPMDTPYFSPGRYGLWGLLFLIRGLPIEAHRAWDAFLWGSMPFLFAIGATTPVKPRWLRWLLVLWGGLFMMQGPTYPMLLIGGFAALAVQTSAVAPRLLPVALGSFYAAVSRWTWMFAGGYWAGLADLLNPRAEKRAGWAARLLPAVITGGVGLAAGVAAYFLFFWNSPTVDLPLNQPLLWNRMFPNPTYRPGILLGIGIASGPLLALLIWLAASRRWKLDAVQAAGLFAGAAATLGAGIVISAKIGGGSNLHNLDMFLGTMMLAAALAAYDLVKRGAPWTLGMRLLVFLAVLAPCTYAASNAQQLYLPPSAEVDAALLTTQNEVAAASGEVLFIDQRQLLSFGYIPQIPFHPEYEKKVLMDQAMAANRPYFEEMVGDMRAQRYALIVTEALHPHIVQDDAHFGDENNAWTYWVANPILCYYEVKHDLKWVGVQLLTPRAEPCADPFSGKP